ncbi:dynamin family protein [Loktanella agnita]|uniref:dynamin family protein n=1 Tax=Loktanella agnita TaxID=287097 RepID=UPI0039859B13
MQQYVVPDALPEIAALQSEIRDFAVRVSLVGQVKAGKTALTNGLINRPKLLPSDVNPWTSVITSVHINAAKSTPDSAIFTFFTEEEWKNMVEIGGRLGEAAQRANFEDELSDIRAQIELMQSNAQRRLGKNFTYLLGNSHKFAGINAKLIKRYVCLGEEEEGLTTSEGRFADLTKSADIYIADPRYDLPTVIRDTPGVNDPFLVRETVTLDSLSDSDICVIVLSAHQAFTTVDIALMRILMALRQEQIVLFINRIDELSDPERQVQEIETYIRSALADQGLQKDLPIIFGSARWARDQHEAKEEQQDANAQDMSGLNALRQIIEYKGAETVGIPLLNKIQQSALDTCRQSILLLQQSRDNATPTRADLNREELAKDLAYLVTQSKASFQAIAKQCRQQVLYDMSAAYLAFISDEKRAIDAIVSKGGKTGDWSADTEKLRRALNSAYAAFDTAGRDAVKAVFADSAKMISKFYDRILDADSQFLTILAPTPAPAPMPTLLMQSMTIDITSNWFETWFSKGRGKDAFVKRFEDVAGDEMRATIKDIQDIYIADFIKAASDQLHGFIAAHVRTLENLAEIDGPQQRSEIRNQLGLNDEIKARLDGLNAIVAELDIEKVD